MFSGSIEAVVALGLLIIQTRAKLMLTRCNMKVKVDKRQIMNRNSRHENSIGAAKIHKQQDQSILYTSSYILYNIIIIKVGHSFIQSQMIQLSEISNLNQFCLNSLKCVSHLVLGFGFHLLQVTTSSFRLHL